MSKTVKLYRNQVGFTMSDGFVLTPRAAIEVSMDCPKDYLCIIQTCMEKGWLQPVAYVKEEEHTWEILTK